MVKERLPLVLGLCAIVAGFILDRLSKSLILAIEGLHHGEALRITPFLDVVLLWNHGISYGLLQQEGGLGRYFLIGIGMAAVLALSLWLLKTQSHFVGLCLGLIIGGALGNIYDRLIFGAVVDFIYFHAFGFSWYVFNLADTWIVAGVGGLLYDSFQRERHRL